MEYKYRKYFGNTTLILGSSFALLKILSLMNVIDVAANLVSLLFILTLVGLCGFFSSMNYGKNKDLSYAGMLMTAGAFLLIFINIISYGLLVKSGPLLTAILVFIIVGSVILGYANLFDTFKNEGGMWRFMFSSIATVAGVFLLLTVLMPFVYSNSQHINKLITFTTVAVVFGLAFGVMAFVLSLVDQVENKTTLSILKYVLAFVFCSALFCFACTLLGTGVYSIMRPRFYNYAVYRVFIILVVGTAATLFSFKIKEKYPPLYLLSCVTALISMPLCIADLFYSIGLSMITLTIVTCLGFLSLLLSMSKKANFSLNCAIAVSSILLMLLAVMHILLFNSANYSSYTISWDISTIPYTICLTLFFTAVLYVFILSRYNVKGRGHVDDSSSELVKEFINQYNPR